VKRLDWFLASRYLASRKGGRLLSFITWVALGGIIVGVTALVLVIGVMTGMQEDLRDKILESNPHVMVLQPGSSLRMDDWRTVLDTVATVDGVTAAAPFVMSNAFLARGGYSQAALLFGVATDTRVGAPTGLEKDILEGTVDLEPPESGLPPVVLGSRLAGVMQVFRGDTVTIGSFDNLEVDTFLGAAPKMMQFEVTDDFTTGMYDADSRNAYTTLAAAQSLMGFVVDDDVSGIEISTVDPGRATAIADVIGERLGLTYDVSSWAVTNAALFSALKLEKLAMGVILFLIVLVAAFNIISTLVMVVADRTREIGILKSMGMTDGAILRVFMLQGAWIGVVGTLIGTFLGLALCWAVDTFDLIRIPPDVYFVDHLPVSLHVLDVVTIVAASILVAFVATIYPSLQASSLEPVEAIRRE
jgi:lipoprotein-releasing system permease protein